MRKGLLSFIIYTILFGGFGILTLITKLQLDAAEGTDGFGLAIGFVIFLFGTIVFAVPFVLKLIHIISGWGFFGFLSVLADIALIGFLVYSMFSGSGIDVYAIIIGLIAALVVALCADIASLKR